MLNRISQKFNIFNYRQKIIYSLSKGSLGASVRNIDDRFPITWEFSSFSQNGEDGIIDYLLTKLKTKNKYFVDIGSSNGIESNCIYLVLVKGYSGLMVEADKILSNNSNLLKNHFYLNIDFKNLFVTKNNADEIVKCMLFKDPDLLSIDVAGNDFYIVNKLFKLEVKSKIIVVPYNATFGTRKITIDYQDDFNYKKSHTTRLYYGVSLELWKNYFNQFFYGLLFFIDSIIFFENSSLATDFFELIIKLFVSYFILIVFVMFGIYANMISSNVKEGVLNVIRKILLSKFK